MGNQCAESKTPAALHASRNQSPKLSFAIPTKAEERIIAALKAKGLI